MKQLLKSLIILAVLYCGGPAFAQGQLQPGQALGNPSASRSPPQGATVQQLLAQSPLTSLAINGCTIGASALCVGGSMFTSGLLTVLSNSATAFSVGPNGATNPGFQVDASTASSATGILIKSAAANGGVGITVISSASNEGVDFNAKGVGVINIGSVSTGAITLFRATTISGTLTLGGGINSAGVVAVLNGGSAQGMELGNLCIDSTYSNCSTVPTNGLQVLGQTKLSAALTYGGVTLSNSVTGTGSMVLSTAPTIAGETVSGTANFTGTFQIAGNTITFPAAAATLTQLIAAGTSALGTGAIASATCATVVTTSATGTATTDTVTASFNGDPTAVTGYVPLTTGMLTIIVYPTANNVNFKVCNNTGSSITPGAITLNWRVVR